jgi:hypothetical protein
MAPQMLNRITSRALVFVLSVLMLSCTEKTNILDPGGVPNSIQTILFRDFASVTLQGVRFSADTTISLNFQTDSVLFSAALAHWYQGSAVVRLLDTLGSVMRLDTLRGDTLISNIPGTGRIPRSIEILARDLTGSLVLQVAKMPPGPAPPDTAAITDDRFDFAVISALLDTISYYADTLIVRDSTRVETIVNWEGRVRWAQSNFATIRESTVRSFIAKNQFRAALRDSLRTRKPCLYFPLGDGIDAYHLRHDLYTFSRIGYSADSMQALVYLNISYWGDGYTIYHLLERRSGRWVLVDSVLSSRS